MKKQIISAFIGAILLQTSFAAVAAPTCESLFRREEKNKAVRTVNRNWMGKADPTVIKGYVIPGGKMLVDTKSFVRNGFESTDYVVSEAFFTAAGIDVPKGAIEIDLSTYGYYDSKKDYGFNNSKERLNRGGGRDHVLVPKDGFTGKVNYAITEKGSGLNNKYSAVNGYFEINNFRKNGLQEHTEVASESTVVRQLENVGLPIVKHPQVRLAPLEFQKMIGSVDQNGIIVGKLAAQTTRVQSAPRDSFDGVENVTNAERFKLVASILINNVGHGGINPENMAKGMLNDPGHVTIGYPIVSGVYRCVLCTGMAGSRADGTMVGIMDYYFPKNEIKSYDDYFNRGYSNTESTKFKFSNEIGYGVFAGITKDLYGTSKPDVLTNDQMISMENLLRQRIIFNQEAFRFSYKTAGKLLKRDTQNKRILSGSDNNISARFLMQLGALKSITSESSRSEVNDFIERVGSLIAIDYRRNYYNLVELFAETHSKSANRNQATRKLFNEYLTLDMILEDAKAVSGNGLTFDKVDSNLKEVIERDSKPVQWDPIEWMRAVNEAYKETYEAP